MKRVHTAFLILLAGAFVIGAILSVPARHPSARRPSARRTAGRRAGSKTAALTRFRAALSSSTRRLAFWRKQTTDTRFEELFSAEESFEIQTRMRLVAVDEWMRAEAALQHAAVRLSLSQVPVGAIDIIDVDEVRIVFSDGTTLVAVDPDARALGTLSRATSTGGRVLLRDVAGNSTRVMAEFDIGGALIRVESRQLLVR